MPRNIEMRTRGRGRLIDISFATFLRALLAIALAWIWLRLWQWLLVFVLAAFLAVALDPAVRWLGRHGIKRPLAAPLTLLLLVLVIGGFFAVTAASLADQVSVLRGQVGDFGGGMLDKLPPEIRQGAQSIAPSKETLTAAAQALAGGLGGIVFALIVTIYFLLDGRRTYEWLLAFVPARHRRRMHDTAMAARDVAAAYVRGNVITCALCALITWIALAAMQVPAALALALLAGILDVVPVVGFVVSAVPALVLAATVSSQVLLAVVAFYVAYNLFENYWLQPRVYGGELRLSDLAVITAFLVGAELGGVLGAVIALPIAALYPAIEQLWLDTPGSTDAADEHRRIEATEPH